MNPTATHTDVSADSLVDTASALLEGGWRLALVAGHDDGDALRVVYTFLHPGDGPHELTLRTDREHPRIPTLAALSYPASRFERELHDLFGIVPVDHPFPRRLPLHSHWPEGWHPLRRDAGDPPTFDADRGAYPFLEVTGTGVYEIPVGPIHAGLIEPGHFRFSVVGETILRLEARQWFLHRGMEKLFEGRTLAQAIPLAERISGDTAVGHGWALVAAFEDALGHSPTPAVQARRMILLELERLHNHVADLGALANDVGFGIAQVHAQGLRERLLRHNAELTGHRLLRGGLGTASWHRPPDLGLLAEVDEEVARLVEITLGHGIVLDRLRETAVLPLERARELGTLGYVARASGVDVDARRDHPPVGLDLHLEPVIERAGDVMARYLVRAREISQSLALIETLLPVSAGPTSADAPDVWEPSAAARSGDGGGAGLGIVEGWRGTVVHRIELDRSGRLTRVKVVDPSWFNWTALPVALAATIVPDFPLANKSFNQSYAGNDL